VGGINVDTLARVEGSLTMATSNPGRTQRAHGGVGRNIAENLARLGTPVRLVGAVGKDADGELVRRHLESVGVDIGCLHLSEEPTGSYTAVVSLDGELVLGVADMSATEALRPVHVDAGWSEDLSLVVVDANLSAETVAHCLELAARDEVPLVLDPVGAAKAARLPHLDGVHTFTPNREELRAWSGLDDIEEAIAKAHADGVELVWLREGRNGSTLHPRGEEAITVSLPAAEAVDVTGAGDSMLAAYVHRVRAGDTPEQAARFGAAAAWLTVSSPYPVRPDLTDHLVTRTLEDLSR
jgi:pseudouridine kinase